MKIFDIPEELSGGFVRRPEDCNKYTVGTVAVVGGSARYAHAPVIAALGARAAGAGLVQLVVPEASRAAAGMHVPEATFAPLGEGGVLPRADVTVVGMGLGMSDGTEALVMRLLEGAKGRIVVDADALSVLAARYAGDGRCSFSEDVAIVLTPHEGEAARLLACAKEDVAADRLAAAREIAGRYGATVVLKGRRTLTVSADGKRVFENLAGNSCMALGGMGDLLAGTIGARWAYLKGDPFLAAASGAWLHSCASDAVVGAMEDPSIANTAARIGSMRVMLDGCAPLMP